MKLLFGLGNPGRRYAKTRHNIGFRIADEVASRFGIKVKTKKFSSLFGIGEIFGSEVAVIKPQSFMNLSGQAVASFWDYFNVKGEDVLVLHDDIDLDLGRMKFVFAAGHGGHNGVRSITEEIGTKEFFRLRAGIGRPPEGVDAADYVLEPFRKNERKLVDEFILRCSSAVELFYEEGAEPVMQRYHNLGE